MRMRNLGPVRYLGIPLALLAACLIFRPFSTELAVERFPMHVLSPVQKGNVRLAGRHLDGLVLQPGETFSFNGAVGPRTAARGYRAAPSYLGEDSPPTPGGGICMLSSALYQLALKTGMRIEARTAHLRPIRSMPPGLDATVWYGGADLRFQNTLGMPVRLRAKVMDNTLILALAGSRRTPPHRIARKVEALAPGYLRVTVFRDARMVSREIYRRSGG